MTSKSLSVRLFMGPFLPSIKPHNSLISFMQRFSEDSNVRGISLLCLNLRGQKSGLFHRKDIPNIYYCDIRYNKLYWYI